MIRRGFSLFASIGDYNLHYRRSRGCFMVAASNFLVGQRDFKMLSFRRVFSNVSTASVVDISNGPRRFKLKGCCSEYYNHSFRNNDDYNGVQNVKAYAPSLQPLLRDLEEVVTVEDPQNGPNSRAFSGVRGAAASANRGSSTRFQGQHFPEKIMVAVDVDEVLGNFISALNRFIANRYSLNHSISEYHVYEFFKIWNCSRDEADIRVHEFFETSYFKKGIHPIPGHDRMQLKKTQLHGLRNIIRAYFRRFNLGITLP